MKALYSSLFFLAGTLFLNPAPAVGAPQPTAVPPATNPPVSIPIPQPLLSSHPGDEVVIVYNTRVPESKGVAEYYAARRKVPAEQILGFSLTTNESISRVEFRDSLQKPLAKELEKRKLWHIASETVPATNHQPPRVQWRVMTSKIRYAVLCYGVPLRIESQPELKEEATARLRPELQRNEAAVDSELAFLPLIEEKLPLAGPLRSPVYTTTNAAMLHPTNGVLLVARLDGPSPEIARGLVDKALAAERDGLWGRAYFDLRNTTEPGLKPGDEWIRSSAEIARRLGFETIVDETPATFPASFPMSQIAYYVGWYDGDVSGPFASPKVEFMPGAFAYHLHSYSAMTVRSATKQWVGPFLAKGVTATMGCVFEPYLSGTPDLATFTARLIFNGFTFGEAAYACQPVLSWQTTVVGDPLYRPFGRNAERLHVELQVQHNPLVAWSFLRLVNLNLGAGKSPEACASLLENLEMTRTNAVLMEKLADMYAAEGKPASATHAYEQALKLGPSPMQALRLLLTLGEKRLAAGQDSEAYEDFRQLLRTYPDYPDKLALYRKLVPLARKLNRNRDAEQYEAEIAQLTQPVGGSTPKRETNGAGRK